MTDWSVWNYGIGLVADHFIYPLVGTHNTARLGVKSLVLYRLCDTPVSFCIEYEATFPYHSSQALLPPKAWNFLFSTRAREPQRRWDGSGKQLLGSCRISADLEWPCNRNSFWACIARILKHVMASCVADFLPPVIFLELRVKRSFSRKLWPLIYFKKPAFY